MSIRGAGMDGIALLRRLGLFFLVGGVLNLFVPRLVYDWQEWWHSAGRGAPSGLKLSGARFLGMLYLDLSLARLGELVFSLPHPMQHIQWAVETLEQKVPPPPPAEKAGWQNWERFWYVGFRFRPEFFLALTLALVHSATMQPTGTESDTTKKTAALSVQDHVRFVKALETIFTPEYGSGQVPERGRGATGLPPPLVSERSSQVIAGSGQSATRRGRRISLTSLISV